MFINSLLIFNSSMLNINIPILKIRKFIHKKVLSLFTIPCCFSYIYPLIFILCIYLLIYSLIYLSLATSPVLFPVTLSGAALAKLLSLNESIMFPFQSLCTHSFHFLECSSLICLHSLLLHFIKVKCSSSELFSKILQFSKIRLLIVTGIFHCFIFYRGSFNFLTLLKISHSSRNSDYLLHYRNFAR